MLLSARSLDRSPLAHARANQEPVSDRAREKKGHARIARGAIEKPEIVNLLFFLARCRLSPPPDCPQLIYTYAERASRREFLNGRPGQRGRLAERQQRSRNMVAVALPQRAVASDDGEKKKKKEAKFERKTTAYLGGGTLGNRRPGMDEGGGDRRQRPPTLGHRDPERRMRTPEGTPPPRSTGAQTNAVQGDAHRPNRRRSLLLPCFSASSLSPSRRRPVGP